MLESGDVMDLSGVDGPKVDKHSTGGVGDKVSLVLAPVAAACGVRVPMISGRGLGHTGGTLDKLESIPGMDVRVDAERFVRIVDEAGLVFAGQTESLCPADRRLYALRDVTATVESVPLIASSIMSKKLAEGIDALVLDVKVGRGAFMKSVGDARELARTMVRIGGNRGKRVAAVLTAMDRPLGRAAGNAVEVGESVELLRGGGPEDLRELVLVLGSWMLVLGGVEDDLRVARSRCAETLCSGAAFERLLHVAELQGGDPSALEDTSRLPLGAHRLELRADRAGVVTDVDALAVGRACVLLGAGRLSSEDSVDPGAGVVLSAVAGDSVDAGDLLATLTTSDPGRLETAARVLRGGFVVAAQEECEEAPLVLEVVR
jgi:pyrimidine-nucleoside phosphorylase/thymidine phosphorylase